MNKIELLMKDTGCSSQEAVNHVANKKLKAKLLSGTPPNTYVLDHELTMTRLVLNHLIDKVYPTL
jgi:hypothetical protein